MAEHGWTPVPRSQSVALDGLKPGKPFQTSEIPIPQSGLAEKVKSYAQEHLNEQTFNHSMRVYLYAKAIQQQHFPQWELSEETLFVTSLLHDIGTTPDNLRATKMSFEFYGGILALDLLKSWGAPVEQAEAVCETIIRHQDLGDTGNVTTLTLAIHLATIFDNVGLNPELIHKNTIVAATEAYPRNKWTSCFAAVVREETSLKPYSHTTHIEGFAEKVEGNKLMEPYD